MEKIILLFLMLTTNTVTLARERFVLKEGVGELALENLDYFEDKDSNRTITDISALADRDWSSSKEKVLNFGYTDSTYWVKFSITNPLKNPKYLFLEVGYPVLDKVDIFTRDNESEWKQKKGGDSIPFREHEVKYNKTVFRIDAPSSSTQLVFLRVQTQTSMQIPLTLWTNLAFMEKVSAERSGLFLYFGIALVMIVYNLFLFISIRKRMYFYYVFWVGSYALMQMTYTGLSYQYFWPEAPSWAGASLPFMASSASLFIVIFTIYFLKLKEYAKWLYWALSFSLVISAANMVLSFVLPYRQIIKLAILPTMIVAPLILLSGFICWRAKYRPARFFLIAFSLFMIGSFLDAARSFGIVPTNFLTAHGSQIGAALEIILLSLALGDRIKLEHDELLKEKTEANKNLVKLYKVKDEFLANTSHELRTPLNGILGFTDLIKKGFYNNDPDRLMEQVGKIGSLAQGLKVQVNTILDLAKSKSDGLELVNSQVSLSDVVEDIKLLVESQILGRKGRTFALEYSWDQGENLVFVNDHEKLMTILRNLLGNAFKFSDPKKDNHVTLSLDLKDSLLTIVVSDNGIGIPESDFDRIYEEFKQVDAQANRAYEGTGLGLAMLKQITDLMGGTVDLESSVGQGSTFTVKIPQQTNIHLTKNSTASERPTFNSQTNKQPLVMKPPKPSGQAKPYNILAVDDNPINCEVIQDILRSQGYPVMLAFGGREALEMIAHSKPDVILLDLMMPEVSGEDVIEYCKSSPEYSDIPIIIITARASQEDRLSVLNIGADEYLAKPFISDEIVVRVRNAVSRLELLHTKVERSELRGQLSAAREVQDALIPQETADLPGFSVEEYFAPAEAAGGDWYQYFVDSKNRRLYVFIGDVTGHGVSSAIVTGLAYGAIHSFLYGVEELDKPPSLEECLVHMNRLVDKTLKGIKHRSGKFMTAVLVGIDLSSGSGLLINAGHHGAYVLDTHDYQRIFKSGYTLGLGSSELNKPIAFDLKRDQSLFLFTDGLIENKGPDGSYMRVRKLEKVLQKYKGNAALKEKILGECQLIWQDHKADDDCTFLVIKRIADYIQEAEAV